MKIEGIIEELQMIQQFGHENGCHNIYISRLDDDAITFSIEVPFDWKNNISIKDAYNKAKQISEKFIIDADCRYSVTSNKNEIEVKLFV